MLRTLAIALFVIAVPALTLAATPSPNPDANGHAMNGHTMNGHAMNGHAMNGHAMNGHADSMKGRPAPTSSP